VASRDRLVDLARKIYETRQARSQYFQNSLLGEPAWDMLLALFCLPLARWGKMTVSRLSQAAGLSLTTGLRWSKMMEQKGLINRTSDPLDARRIFVTLSSKGDRLMCDYLSTVHQQLMDD
jgi:DNA-binding MarR family transcriptional regulator